MSSKDADRMANSVDPDQTAPLGSLIWVCTVCPGISVRKLRIITVFLTYILFFLLSTNLAFSALYKYFNTYQSCYQIHLIIMSFSYIYFTCFVNK